LEVKIKNINEDFLKDLITFNSTCFVNRNKLEESINYRIIKNPYNKNKFNSIIAVENDTGEIVGQELYMPAYVYYNKISENIVWGHDLFVKENYRGAAGLLLFEERNKRFRIVFGIGLSEMSFLIHMKLRFKLYGNMVKFIKFRSLFSIIDFIFKRNNSIYNSFPEIVNSKIGEFKRVYNSDDMINEQKIWNSNVIEFDRYRDFLDWRFFYYKDKYKVYKCCSESNENNISPVYFVLREIVFKNNNCLLLVDYRCNINNKTALKSIFQTALKILKITKSKALITGCSFREGEKILKHSWFFPFGIPLQIVSNIHNLNPIFKNLDDNIPIFVTFADSDSDFYYGNEEW